MRTFRGGWQFVALLVLTVTGGLQPFSVAAQTLPSTDRVCPGSATASYTRTVHWASQLPGVPSHDFNFVYGTGSESDLIGGSLFSATYTFGNIASTDGLGVWSNATLDNVWCRWYRFIGASGDTVSVAVDSWNNPRGTFSWLYRTLESCTSIYSPDGSDPCASSGGNNGSGGGGSGSGTAVEYCLYDIYYDDSGNEYEQLQYCWTQNY